MSFGPPSPESYTKLLASIGAGELRDVAALQQTYEFYFGPPMRLATHMSEPDAHDMVRAHLAFLTHHPQLIHLIACVVAVVVSTPSALQDAAVHAALHTVYTTAPPAALAAIPPVLRHTLAQAVLAWLSAGPHPCQAPATLFLTLAVHPVTDDLPALLPAITHAVQSPADVACLATALPALIPREDHLGSAIVARYVVTALTALVDRSAAPGPVIAAALAVVDRAAPLCPQAPPVAAAFVRSIAGLVAALRDTLGVCPPPDLTLAVDTLSFVATPPSLDAMLSVAAHPALGPRLLSWAASPGPLTPAYPDLIECLLSALTPAAVPHCLRAVIDGSGLAAPVALDVLAGAALSAPTIAAALTPILTTLVAALPDGPSAGRVAYLLTRVDPTPYTPPGPVARDILARCTSTTLPATAAMVHGPAGHATAVLRAHGLGPSQGSEQLMGRADVYSMINSAIIQ